MKTNTKNNKLKPCPFCGKKETPTLTTAQDSEACSNFEDGLCPACFDSWGRKDCEIHFVVCNFTKGGCGASSGWRKTTDEAINSWNERCK